VYNNPLKVYQEIDKSGMSGREVEAYALTKAAMALRECQGAWETPERDALLDQALKLNQRVWNIIQVELTRTDNPMPRPIKQNLLRLSAFIDTRTLELIAEPKPERLNIIISINENLAAGLRQAGETESDTGLSLDSGNSKRQNSPLSVAR
jgi:flagellar protein FlaF